MCGIHGIYRFDDQSVSPAALSAMGDVTRHRGPDDEGRYVDPDGRCGIAMRRLSIIDLAGGHQPISSADDMLWIVCNGEIYNFRELRTELQDRGYRFKTGSDSEVLVHLYDAFGDDFVHRLDGMFNFALWDARRKRLLIGRDPLGVKPLYVHRSASMLAFATEAKALLELPGVGRELDRDVVADYLHLGYVAAPHSMFRDIRKLPPATLLSIENGEVRQWRYWRLPSRVDREVSERDWIDRIRDGMERAVHRQMVSDVPIGAFLSGGVDSSAVVAFMAKHSAHPIRTYAIGFEGGEAERLYNELPYARQVASLIGTEHHEIVVKPDVVGLLPKLLWHMDEPVADSAFITTYLVSEFARRDVKVILSGVGGDELFGGYRRYLGGHYVRKLQRLPRWSRQWMSRTAALLPSDRHSKVLNTMRLARGFLASAELSPDDRYRHYLQVLDRALISELMNGASGATDALTSAFAAAGDEDPLNRMFAVDAETQLPDDLLLLTDKMSMAVSLECRVPLLDRELVELAAVIPESLKVRDGRLKHLMKEALADVLPADILDRKKRGFGTPMGAWLKRDLAPVLRRLLSTDVVRDRRLFNPAVVARLMADHDANRIDGTDALLALMNLEIWSRIYLDRRSPDDVTTELKAFLA
jgi:asparagine synthase (glutamine-hydrolysing)